MDTSMDVRKQFIICAIEIRLLIANRSGALKYRFSNTLRFTVPLTSVVISYIETLYGHPEDSLIMPESGPPPVQD